MSNVTITIGADAAKLRAELAIATTEWRNYSREMNAAARQAVRTGSELAEIKTAEAAANVNRMTAEISRLKAEMAEIGKTPFMAIHESVEGALSSVSTMRGAFRELGETIGAALAVEKLADWTRETAETAEHIGNMSAALGLSVGQYSELRGAMLLATGSAEGMDRALLLLSEHATRALENPEGAEMDRFRKLGYDVTTLRAALSDLPGFLRKIADQFKEMPAGERGVFSGIFGVREIAAIVPLLKNGAEGIDELTREAHGFGIAYDENVNAKLEKTAEKIHELSAAWEGFKTTVVSTFSDQLITALTNLTDALSRASGQRELFSAQDKEILQRLMNIGAAGGPLAAVLAPVGGYLRSGATPGGGSVTFAPGVLPPPEPQTGRTADRHDAAGEAPELPKDSVSGPSAGDAARTDAEIASMMKHVGEQLHKACAELVNEALRSAGFPTSGSDLAESFKAYGEAIKAENVRRGDIFYAPPSGTGDTGHVGVALGPAQNGYVPVVSSHMQGAASNPAGAEWRSAADLTFRRPVAGEAPAPTQEHPRGADGEEWLTANARKALEAQWAKREADAAYANDLASKKQVEQEKLEFAQKSIDDQNKYLREHFPTAPKQQAEIAAAGRDVQHVEQEQAAYAFHTQLAELQQREDAARRIGDLAQVAAIEHQKAALVANFAHATAAEKIEAATRAQDADAAVAAKSFALLDDAAQKQAQINDRNLAGAKAKMQTAVDKGQLTPQQALGFDIQDAAKTHDQSIANFAPVKAAALTPEDRQRVTEQMNAIDADSQAKIDELKQQWTAAGEKAAEEFAKPFRSAFDQLGTGLESALTDALSGKRGGWAQAIQKLRTEAIGGVVGIAGSGLSKAAAGPLGNLLGQSSTDKSGNSLGVGDVLGNKLGELFKSIMPNFGQLFGGATQAATGAATQAATQAPEVAAVTTSMTEMASTTTGAMTTMVADVTTAMTEMAAAVSTAMTEMATATAVKAVVPFAAGGWDVPSFAGGGWSIPGGLAMLHPREMVLPAHLAEGVRNMVGNGGAGGARGGGDMHFYSHFGAFSDAGSVQRGMRPVISKLRAELRAGIPS